jgi:hypothetical protein
MHPDIYAPLLGIFDSVILQIYDDLLDAIRIDLECGRIAAGDHQPVRR